jgi:hypothetical protein
MVCFIDKENEMKIYLKDSGRTILIKDEGEGLDIHELFELFRDACLAMGYHPNSFKNAVLNLAEDYEIAEEK